MIWTTKIVSKLHWRFDDVSIWYSFLSRKNGQNRIVQLFFKFCKYWTPVKINTSWYQWQFMLDDCIICWCIDPYSVVFLLKVTSYWKIGLRWPINMLAIFTSIDQSKVQWGSKYTKKSPCKRNFNLKVSKWLLQTHLVWPFSSYYIAMKVPAISHLL